MHKVDFLWLHCIWVFGSQALTVVTYAHMFYSLRKHVKNTETLLATAPRTEKDTHQALWNLIVFPVVYIIMTLPLCIAMMMFVTGQYVSIGFEVAAGIMVDLTGTTDCILYPLTRKQLFWGNPRGDQGLFRLRSEPVGRGTNGQEIYRGPSQVSFRHFFKKSQTSGKRHRLRHEPYSIDISPLRQHPITSSELTSSTKPTATVVRSPSPCAVRSGERSRKVSRRTSYLQRTQSDTLTLRNSIAFSLDLGAPVEEPWSSLTTPSRRRSGWKPNTRTLNAPARVQEPSIGCSAAEPYPGA